MVSKRTALWLVVSLVWLANLMAGFAGFYVLANWSAFTWIIGQPGWSVAFEIVVILSLIYVLLTGCCVLGTEKTQVSTLWRLKGHRQMRLWFALGIPLLILTLFTTLTVLAFVEAPATYSYIESHAHYVFEHADLNDDQYVSFKEFSDYTLALDHFKESNSTTFRMFMARVFDAMDADSNGFITPDNMYTGVGKALDRPRRRLGYSGLVLCCVVAIFTVVFWTTYFNYFKIHKKHYPRDSHFDRQYEGSEGWSSLDSDQLSSVESQFQADLEGKAKFKNTPSKKGKPSSKKGKKKKTGAKKATPIKKRRKEEYGNEETPKGRGSGRGRGRAHTEEERAEQKYPTTHS